MIFFLEFASTFCDVTCPCLAARTWRRSIDHLRLCWRQTLYSSKPATWKTCLQAEYCHCVIPVFYILGLFVERSHNNICPILQPTRKFITSESLQYVQTHEYKAMIFRYFIAKSLCCWSRYETICQFPRVSQMK